MFGNDIQIERELVPHRDQHFAGVVEFGGKAQVKVGSHEPP